MVSTKSAIRYATALMELSLAQGKMERIEKDLSRFEQVVHTSNDFRTFLNSPVIRDDKKIAIYQQILTDFDELTMGFFSLVTKNGREQLLPEIARQFHRLLEKHRDIVSGLITTASALDAETKQAIIRKVSSSFNGNLSLKEEVDPSLIGGFIIRIDDKQIDASVASKLKQLKQELTT
ncbi:MAG: ATP synthase F1 subunit delta [Bacteroidetes bacterium]|nr:ATP synthase F1 subunit delta [Bacteroidota bacterium]